MDFFSIFRTSAPVQRQISQQPQQQSQQKFYVAKTNSPAASSNIVKIQQNQKIFIQSSGSKVYVSNPSNPQLDDLSHLE